MKNSCILIFSVFLFNFEVVGQTLEYQGAKIRILNKDTTEKFFYNLPLSQTLEINNSVIVVHRCVRLNTKERQDDIALLSHKSFYENKLKNNFFGWIFKSSHYMNSPHNSSLDIRLHSCLENDPIFLKKSED